MPQTMAKSNLALPAHILQHVRDPQTHSYSLHITMPTPIICVKGIKGKHPLSGISHLLHFTLWKYEKQIAIKMQNSHIS